MKTRLDRQETIPLLDRFKLARGLIEHENTLVSHRVTWFLSMQALLFAAFFIVAQLPWKESSDCYGGLTILALGGTLLIAGLGLGSSWLVYVLLAMALTELDGIAKWWDRQTRPGDLLPRISGPVPNRWRAHQFAWAFVLAWAVLLLTFGLAARDEIAASRAWMKSSKSLSACKKAEAEARGTPPAPEAGAPGVPPK